MISVVIPVRNGGVRLRRCLEAIKSQRVDEEIEIVVVDSGSTDGTPALARSLGARVHEIAPHEFNHGGTRNTGAALSRGQTLVFTVDDAVATSDRWLARLVAPLLSDERVGACYGRQVAYPDAVPPERFFIEFLYGDQPRLQRAGEQRELTMETTMFSNVNSAIRRSVWERLPFTSDIIMSEDQEWSQRALLAGYAIAYVPEAAVEHSHRYTIAGAFKRFFDSGVSAERAYLAGGAAAAATMRSSARRYAREELAWLWRTSQRGWIPYAVVYELAKFAGLQLGVRWRRLPRSVCARLSRLPVYWTDEAARARAGANERGLDHEAPVA